MSFVDLVRETAFHVRTRKGWTITKSGDQASFLITADGTALAIPAGSVSVSIGPYTPEFETAVARLATGAPLAEIRNDAIAAGTPVGAASLLLMLQRLYHWGMLELALVGEAGELAVVLPQWDWFTPTLSASVPAPDASIHRFAFLRRDSGGWLLESPLCGARLFFETLDTLQAPPVRRFLAAAGFLDTEHEPGNARQEALAQWEFHDLVIHMHNQVGWHHDPIGGMYPFIDEIEPSPSVRPNWPGRRITLDRAPSGPSREPFADVLVRRRSERVYDEDHPISLSDLGALLDRAARIRSFDHVTVGNFLGRVAPFEFTARPYPNGGASYELEIYPIVARCAGLEPALYHYDPHAHELVRICEPDFQTDRIIQDSKISTGGLADPQVMLVLAARFGRVMWKYRSIAYAVILRNTGVLYQTLYLAATELGFSPCGLGSVNSAAFARATGLDPVIEGAVGGFILGGRPYGS